MSANDSSRDSDLTSPPPCLCILVADDEPLIVKAIATFFTARGHTVHSALDAPSAMSLLDAHRFDAALVDLHMPGDGSTVIDRMQDDPDFDGRIVLMSGAVASDPKWQRGPGLIRLRKPFRLAELAPMVEGDIQH